MMDECKESETSVDLEKKRSERAQKYLIFLCWLVYTIAQIARYSYSSNITLIMKKYGVSHASAGLPSTFYFFAYATGQIITGIFCKNYNRKFVVTGALTVSACCNLALFLNVDFTYIKYIWAINGFAQSNLWPLLLLLIGENVSEKYKRGATIAMSSATSVGTLLAYAIGVIFARSISVFRYAFLVSATAALLVATLWLFGCVGQKKATAAASVVMNEKKQTASKGSGKRSIVLLLCIFSEFAVTSMAISGGLRQWVPSIMQEEYGLSDRLSIFLTLLLPLVSIAGSFISAWLYAKIKSFTVIIGGMFLLSIVLLGVLLAVMNISWILVMIDFILVTLGINVIQNQLTAQVPFYMQDKMNAGFLAGIMNGSSYMGNALSTYGLGAIADHSGWNGVFLLLLGVAIFSTGVAITYYFLQKRRKTEMP